MTKIPLSNLKLAPNSAYVGRRYSRLTVVRVYRAETDYTCYICECICDCGNTAFVMTANLRGSTQSCGCVKRKPHNKLHGKNKTPEHRTWVGLKTRCLNPRHPSYKYYGGRGITVHPSWIKDFNAFLRDVGPRPSSLHSLDRIDPHGNYEPGNVRWATDDEQANNKTNCILLTWDGRTQTAAKWADEIGILRPTIYARIQRGYPTEMILSKRKLPNVKSLNRSVEA